MAADAPTSSRIDSVIVFPQGAEVTRKAHVRLDAGEGAIIVSDLPSEAVASSIRVEGKATAKLDLGSVDSRKTVVTSNQVATLAADRKRLEDEIERLKDDKARLEAQINAGQQQKEFLKALAGLPGTAGDGSRPTPREDWGQILSLIGTAYADIETRSLDVRTKIRDLDRTLADKTRELAKLAPKPEERTEVRIAYSAAAPLEADLLVRYQVNRAAWLPGYEARLDTGSKSQNPSIKLMRRATIQQRTTESWNDVALTLSTTRPASSTAAPELRTQTVDYPAPIVVSAVPVPASAPAVGAVRRAKSRDAEPVAGAAHDEATELAAKLQDIGVQEVKTDLGTFQAEFAMPGRSSVPNTGEPKSLVIEQVSLEPQLIARAVPKREERAYLYAKLVVPKGAPYLPGSVALFRDNTFVGTGLLPQLGPGETHELGFAADDMVRVKYTIQVDKRGEQGLIAKSKTDDRSYKIVVKNLHPRQIQIRVLDQIPVSGNDEIKVEFTSSIPPTQRDVDDKRGVMAWEDKLNPDEERVIELSTRVTWPGAKTVTYGG